MARTLQTARNSRGPHYRSRPPHRTSTGRVKLLVEEMKKGRFRISKEKAAKPQAVASKVEVKRHGTFNLLSLPRELRDEIYSLALGTQSGAPRNIYDSVKTRAHHHLRADRRSSRRLHPVGQRSESALLFANHRIHHEVMDTVYYENTFFVTMDTSSPIFRTQTKKAGDEQGAVPFGWDLSRVNNMVLRLDLGASPNYDAAFEALKFTELGRMEKLAVLRVVVTIWDHWYTQENKMKFLDLYVGENGIAHSGSPAFRGMIKRLRQAIPRSVRRLEFGLTFAQDEIRPDDWRDLNSESCVPGESLGAVFEDVEAI